MRRAIFAALLLTLSGGVWSNASAEINKPDCAALTNWAQQVGRHSERAISMGWVGRLGIRAKVTLPGIFSAPITKAIFGMPGLDWSRRDTGKLSSMLRSCQGKAANDGEKSAFKKARNAQNSADRYIGYGERAIKRVKKGLYAFANHQFDPKALPFLAAVANGFTAETDLKIRKLVDTLPNTLRYAGEGDIYGQWPYLKPADFEKFAQPEIQRIAEQYRAQGLKTLLSDVQKTLRRGRELDGFTRLTAQIKKHKVMAAMDSAGRLAVTNALSARRTALIDSVAKGYSSQIAAVVGDNYALSALSAIPKQSNFKYLPPANRNALTKAIIAKEVLVIPLVSDAALKAIQDLPKTGQRLMGAMRLRTNTEKMLSSRSYKEAAAAFTEKADPLIAAHAASALPEFAKRLASLPVAPDSLRKLQGAEKWLATWPPFMAKSRAHFTATVAARRQAINTEIASAAAAKKAVADAALAAIEKAEKGPLTGRIYAAEGNVQVGPSSLEFIDRKRVLVTLPDGGIQAGTWEEIAGARVIITLPGSNFVLARKGQYLRGARIALRRAQAQ